MLGDFIEKLKLALERDALRARFERYPLLQILLCEFWFRVVFIGFIVFGLTLALCLPKIWRTSPDGFLPIIRISVVDRMQAWSLKRTAMKAEAARDQELALFSWQSAVGNNVADPAMVRHLIRYVMKNDEQLIRAPMAIGQTTWLLRLTQTNRVDLELAAEVFNKYRMPTLSLLLLEPYAHEFTDSMAGSYLKALFESGQIEKFSKYWEKCPQTLKQDPELKLYYAAYLAGWQSDILASQGRRDLAAAMGNANLENLALRLLLQVNAKLGDISGYEQTLDRLRKIKADLVLEHVVKWKLLAHEGRKIEAAELAQNFTNAPLTAVEAQELSAAYANLGLREKARQTLAYSVGRFAYAPALWESMAEMMIESHQWLELQALALRIRDERSVRETMRSYSHYLEGRAQLGQSRPSEAVENFKTALVGDYTNLQLALRMADNLTRLGYSSIVKDFLIKIEKQAGNELVYWQIIFNTAFALKDDNLLMRAAVRARELKPQNPVILNNYAAALLILRQKPDEAIKITKQLTLQLPSSTAMAINHCFALLLNRRTPEAEAVLQTMKPGQLKPQEINDYHLAWFEVYLQKKQFDLARNTVARIETNDFFPAQRSWYEMALKSLPAK